VPSIPPEALPATKDIDKFYDENLFTVSLSPNHFLNTEANHSEAHLITADNVLQPHPSYHSLLQLDKSDVAHYLGDISEALRQADLHICSDGAFLPDIGQGAHAWVFARGDGTVIFKGCGPANGHPKVMSPYRAELTGLVTALFIIHWACEVDQPEEGAITIYCDNETALGESFASKRPSHNPYRMLAADHDLISLVRDLIQHLPSGISIKNQWVKGHVKGKKTFPEELNSIAD
jgi:ribonuclease HI